MHRERNEINLLDTDQRRRYVHNGKRTGIDLAMKHNRTIPPKNEGKKNNYGPKTNKLEL